LRTSTGTEIFHHLPLGMTLIPTRGGGGIQCRSSACSQNSPRLGRMHAEHSHALRRPRWSRSRDASQSESGGGSNSESAAGSDSESGSGSASWLSTHSVTSRAARCRRPQRRPPRSPRPPRPPRPRHPRRPRPRPPTLPPPSLAPDTLLFGVDCCRGTAYAQVLAVLGAILLPVPRVWPLDPVLFAHTWYQYLRHKQHLPTRYDPLYFKKLGGKSH